MAKKKIKALRVKVKCGFRFFIDGKIFTCGDVLLLYPKDIIGQENKLTEVKELYNGL